MNDNNDTHDETNCEGLHEVVNFSIRAYSISKGSLAFDAWFKEVFTVQNPESAKDFDFTFNVDSDGQKVLEIMQHNPMFSIDSLESLFVNWERTQRHPDAKPNIVPFMIKLN